MTMTTTPALDYYILRTLVKTYQLVLVCLIQSLVFFQYYVSYSSLLHLTSMSPPPPPCPLSLPSQMVFSLFFFIIENAVKEQLVGKKQVLCVCVYMEDTHKEREREDKGHERRRMWSERE